MTTRDVCYIGIFVAVIAVCSQVSVPLPGLVPFSLQTWAISLAGILLGAKKGVLAVAIYILLGAIGVPVFAQFRGGIDVIFGVTGGFILSFPVLAFFAGISRNTNARLVAGIIAGTIINYAFGLIWFSFATGNRIEAAFAMAVAPFILPDIFKIIAAIIVGRSIQMALAKAKIM